MKKNTFIKYLIVAVFALHLPLRSWPYSILTHEAIIDVTWDKATTPLLLKKYPSSTEAQLKEANAYAYGGAIAPDMGYYPFGSKLFTNLMHYVRTGDFVNEMLDEAQDVNEYAFAIGVLSHYYADKYGH
jgi:Zinc dependent phospholipase C